MVALSQSINMEECRNGIRSTALSPGEVATPILAKRPVPVSDEDKARMLQSEDLGDLIRYIACLPPRVCLNDVLITPTWNRATSRPRTKAFELAAQWDGEEQEVESARAIGRGDAPRVK